MRNFQLLTFYFRLSTIDQTDSPSCQQQLHQIGDGRDRHGRQLEIWAGVTCRHGSLTEAQCSGLSNPNRGSTDGPHLTEQANLPEYHEIGGQRPVANVRVGWAFHTDPSDENAPRYPAQDGTFAYQLDATALETIRSEQMSFVQWDILFDMSYVEVGGDTPPALNPETNRPELHFLRLPFRF